MQLGLTASVDYKTGFRMDSCCPCARSPEYTDGEGLRGVNFSDDERLQFYTADHLH